MKQICVYCGSRDGDDPAFAKAAETIGAGLAARGMGLVYGAGDVGLMGRVATAALKGGAPVTGVIPHHLRSLEIDKDDLTELITRHTRDEQIGVITGLTHHSQDTTRTGIHRNHRTATLAKGSTRRYL